MSQKNKKTVRLFDKFSLAVSAKLRCDEDGIPGRRVLFIADQKDTFTVSFEEGMQMWDMLDETKENSQTVSHQCCMDGKYIHQRRKGSSSDRCAFFHIELEDDDGKILHLPGQMVVSDGYKWTDGIEPVLMNLLEDITVF